jgi:hypothetical protein
MFSILKQKKIPVGRILLRDDYLVIFTSNTIKANFMNKHIFKNELNYLLKNWFAIGMKHKQMT